MAKENTTGWVGWIAFAAIFMVLAGFFQAIFGLTALFNSTVIVSAPSSVWLVDLTTWGWAHLLLGVILAVAGLSLIKGSMWARVVAVIVVGISAIANFLSIPIYPLWSLIIITVDIFVIYAITAHGGEMMEMQ